MPIQAPQWNEYLTCPVCEHSFDGRARLPVNLGCGHVVCRPCIASLKSNMCPFDQTLIRQPSLPVNTALLLLADSSVDVAAWRLRGLDTALADEAELAEYVACASLMERLAGALRPTAHGAHLPRSMQRRLIAIIGCQMLDEDGRAKLVRALRIMGERSVTELLVQHQTPGQVSANLWAAVRSRGCQFLGPAMQEEVLKLILLALEDGSALSRKVLVMFVVQKLEIMFPQSSKTCIGHVVQLLYRASCFRVAKRDGDSSLMQLKEEFRQYDALRREHDAQIVAIATEAGLRIVPDQWSSLLYGDIAHKSHMQSIIDRQSTASCFPQSIQELVIVLQRTGDPRQLVDLRPHLDILAAIDPAPDSHVSDWDSLRIALNSAEQVISGLLAFMEHNALQGRVIEPPAPVPLEVAIARYKTSMCRDMTSPGGCPRTSGCTFAHSIEELEHYRKNRRIKFPPRSRPDDNVLAGVPFHVVANSALGLGNPGSLLHHSLPPVAQVAPFPRSAPFGPTIMPNVMGPMGPPIGPPPGLPLMAVADSPMQVIMAEQFGPPPSHMDMPIMGPPPAAFVTPSAVMPTMQPAPGMMMAMAMPPMLGPGTGVTGPSAASMALASSDHISNADRFPVASAEGQAASHLLHMHVPPGITTSSLSALRSRKDQIMGHLGGLVGVEEVRSIIRKGPREPPRPHAMPTVPESSTSDTDYSMWTSRSLVTLASGVPNNHSYNHNNNNYIRESPKRTVSHRVVAVDRDYNDQFVPLPDGGPQLSRFGPISRPGAMLMSTATGARSMSQSQASISDEPSSTVVLRHSRQLAHTVPSVADMYPQNGGHATFQPVAMGMNGEIGYIAVPSAGPAMVPAHDPMLQHIQQSSIMHQQHPMAVPAPVSESAGPHVLFAESERRRHDLTVLQKKISDLSLANVEHAHHPALGSSNRQLSADEEKECAELSRELQMIESTIREREDEISSNHIMAAAIESGTDGGTGGTGSDPGVGAEQQDKAGDRHGLLDEIIPRGIMTTASSGLCPKVRGAGGLVIE